MRLLKTTQLSIAVAASFFGSATAFAADWMQFGYDGAHSGFNPAENAISASNVAQLHTLYNVDLAATVDSAPIYLSNVSTSGGTKSLLFALSTNGRLMAIDAATGAEVWHQSTTGHQPTTASPAIDPNRQFVYSYGVDGFAHKYQVGDGTEITTGGWPQTITLKPSVEKGAGGLTIANSSGTNYLVVVTDGYIGDGGDYQGHLVSINLATGAQKIFNVMCSDLAIHFVQNGTSGTDDCSGRQSGIWGRGGATFDSATGRVYIATGNGHYSASTGGLNWGDSTLALNVDGTGAGGGMPRDSWTPTTFQQLQDQDRDLGSVGMAVLPASAGSAVAHIGMQAGKDGILRLINLDNMSGQGGPAHVGGELQSLNVPQGGNGYPNDRMREQPAVWINPADRSTWTFVGNGSGISGLKLGIDGNNQPSLSTSWTKTNQATDRSSSPIVANGVLFNAGSCASGTCVNARDPLTGTVLWSSPALASLHWQSPIVVDGVVYMLDGNGVLWAFGGVKAPDEVFTNGFDP